MDHALTQTGDTVVLKAHPTLIGTVERTYHDFNTHQDPLAGLLIFSHVAVPDPILQEFLTSRAPPKGYLFVRFADEEFGNSLVAEEDVVLLSRCFGVGDTVKLHAEDHMIGTVVDVHDVYTIQPICWPRHGSGDFLYTFDDDKDGVAEDCGMTCEPGLPSGVAHRRPHTLLYNVPGRELKRAQDFQEGDHVLYRDWLGTVRAVDVDVAIMLPNQTVVWVYDPYELFVVIPSLDRSPVAIPELESTDIRLPELNLQIYNGIETMQPEQFMRGQLIVTNHRNLKNGRWLHGGYDPKVEPAGRVLDVRSRRLELQPLCPNAFSAGNFNDMVSPPMSLPPYENLTSFRNARDLRRKRDLVLYDHDKSPMPDVSSTSDIASSTANGQNSNRPGHTDADNRQCSQVPEAREMGMDLRVGERVKFVDTAAALKTYVGTGLHAHGRYTKIPRDDTFGFDLNEFKIITVSEDVTIQWQDQSTSRHRAVDLRAVTLPEQDLVPGDLVTAKEGMKQVHDQAGHTIISEFNEMSYFEHQQELRPEKVGVVQSVNPRERIAQVRWFQNPTIGLLEAGTILHNDSKFGEIGESIQDVSLYEIMSFPALTCRRRDLVVIVPPSSLNSRTNELLNPGITSATENNSRRGPALLSQLGTGDNRGLVSHLMNVAAVRLQSVISAFGTNVPETGSTSTDWVAEIVDVGLDGLLTIRFGAIDPARDIRISRDQILLTIDIDDAYPGDDLMADGMGTGSSWGASDDEEMFDEEEDALDAIDEEIDYEGGQRMDNDSDDSGWVTDEEGPSRHDSGAIHHLEEARSLAGHHARNSIPDEDVEMQEVSEQATSEPSSANIVSDATPVVREDVYKDTRTLLAIHKPSEPPPQFEVVTTLPANQFHASDPPTTSPSFLKRIAREHKILRSSLPTNTIYIRTYESRLDLLRCLIVGPADTPYELAPFLIDLHLGPQFPKEPPTAHFHSWTSGMGRINPNLYEEGKICLSLLGTWPGKSEGEGWSEKATILQLLVSLQGLVFVRQPLYNEAGFELYREEKLFTLESQQYNEKAFVVARGFLKHALLRPVEGLEDVLAWLYLPPKSSVQGEKQALDLLRKAIDRARTLMQRSEALKNEGKAEVLVDGIGGTEDAEKVFLKPLSLGAMVQLRRTVGELEGIVDAFTK